MAFSFLKRAATSAAQLSSNRHSVEFYEPGCFPAGGIAEYFCAGHALGEGMLTIATAEHVREIRDCLILAGVAISEMERDGSCTWLDADAVLGSLRAGGPLSQQTVDVVLCPPLLNSIRASATGRVRVYGELVNLIAQSGEHSDCVLLESHWNRLLGTFSFQLHCAYSAEHCSEEASARVVQEIWKLHDEVGPLAAGSGATDWLAVSIEQARALHDEMEIRKGLEEELAQCRAERVDQFSEQIVSLLEIARLKAGCGNYDVLLVRSPREWNRLVTKTLKDILKYCGEVIEARRKAPEGSPEWHKRTGEILACAQLTSSISELEDGGRKIADLVN
jgi:hypothetical protein